MDTSYLYYLYLHNGNMEGDCDDMTIPTNNPNITMDDVKKVINSKEGVVWGGWEKTVDDVTDEAVEDFSESMLDEFVGGW